MKSWVFPGDIHKIYGEAKDIRSLYEKMRRLQDRKKSLIENGFGKTWLGNLVARLGESHENVGCRGYWEELKIIYEYDTDTSDGKPRRFPVLTFYTYTAWSRCEEVEQLIESAYPDLWIFFISEELGNGVFETNDEEGDVFPEQVIVDDETDGMEYFTEQGAIEHLNTISTEAGGNPITTWDEAEAFCERRNEAADAANDASHIYLHKAEAA